MSKFITRSVRQILILMACAALFTSAVAPLQADPTDVPHISDLQLIHATDDQWIIYGTVDDDNPDGLVVYFSGPPGFQGITADVYSDGSFFALVCLEAVRDDGLVGAKVTNWYDLTSPIAYTNSWVP